MATSTGCSSAGVRRATRSPSPGAKHCRAERRSSSRSRSRAVSCAPSTWTPRPSSTGAHTGVLNLPNGRRFDITIDFDNWRDVDGVKFPFDIMEERTGKEPVVTLVTYTDKIELNVPMDDGLFAAPAAASAPVK